MKAHWSYLKYVIRHKWFVLLACNACRVSLWRAVIHDWTKFLPCEWNPYVQFFYGSCANAWDPIGPAHIRRKQAFNEAWDHHQNHNKHHWQYWVLINDSDNPKYNALPMPLNYIREMVADWWGAGRAITGKWDACKWYDENRENILLHDETRKQVEEILNRSSFCFFNELEMPTTVGYAKK